MVNRSTRSHATSTSSFPLIAFVLALSLAGGLIIVHSGSSLSLGIAILLIVLFASFLNTELGLHIILLSMLLSPEIVVGGVGGISVGKPLTKGDSLVVRMEDLVLVTVALAWFARTAIFKELGLVRKTPLNRPMAAYVSTLVLATLLGMYLGNVNPLRGFFFTLKYIEFFVVYFMAVNYVRDEGQMRRLLKTVFVTCALSALIGLAQIPSGERVSAPFEGKAGGEPNTFGGYLVFMLALILAQVLSAQSLPVQLGWAGFAGLVALPLLFTLSRTSWLASIPMLLTLIALSPRRLILMIGLGMLVVVGPLAFPKQVVDRYNYTLDAQVDRSSYRLGERRFDESTGARFDSFRYGFQGFTRRPSLGYGVTGYAFMDAQFFRVLVESGLVGLVAFLWLLRRLLQIAWRTHKVSVGTRFEGLTLGYLGGLVAMIVHGVGANTFIIVRIMEPFWFMTGLIVLLPLLREQEGQGTPGRRSFTQLSGAIAASKTGAPAGHLQREAFKR